MIKWFWPFFVPGIAHIANAGNIITESVYKDKLNDPEAVYFSPENFRITADSQSDLPLQPLAG